MGCAEWRGGQGDTSKEGVPRIVLLFGRLVDWGCSNARCFFLEGVEYCFGV
jgi:hypothetical protein